MASQESQNLLVKWWKKKYFGTPHFFTQKFSPKMTQNGLKYIFNTTFQNVTFWHNRPPPVTLVTFFMKAFLNQIDWNINEYL